MSPSYDDVDLLGNRNGREVSSQAIVDAQLSLDLGEVMGEMSPWNGFEIRAGAFNLLDAQPPFAEVGGLVGYDPTQADLQARFGYVKVERSSRGFRHPCLCEGKQAPAGQSLLFEAGLRQASRGRLCWVEHKDCASRGSSRGPRRPLRPEHGAPRKAEPVQSPSFSPFVLWETHSGVQIMQEQLGIVDLGDAMTETQVQFDARWISIRFSRTGRSLGC